LRFEREDGQYLDLVELSQLRDEMVDDILKRFGGRVVGQFKEDFLEGDAVLFLANGQVSLFILPYQITHISYVLIIQIHSVHCKEGEIER
jgi:hypothetical protein